ncbi:MAG: bifunctional nicotinamidase/pyrazinamidase [Planctomycetota bacterium]|nr:bifunctional nicotinamidase/pyrazinamidase [Planctomycetota bacterium]
MDVLLLVDLQNDFLPGGTLPVTNGDQVIDIANQLQQHFDTTLATQDWHPSQHASFAATHPGHQVGDVLDLGGIPQILWPVHCVQQTLGAEFAPQLNTTGIQHVFAKGTDPHIDSYSGFFDNGGQRSTGLEQYLRQRAATRLFVMGLATDYCVQYTVLDALHLGLATVLVTDGCRGVEQSAGDCEAALTTMHSSGALLMPSDRVIQERHTAL